MFKNILKALIILSGIFCYQVIGSDRFYFAQETFFTFSFGLIFSYLIYKYNRVMGYMLALCSLIFLKTALFQNAPILFNLKTYILILGCFGIYFCTRFLKLKEDILKLFMIPVMINALVIIVQRFDLNFLPILPVSGVTGFLGNSSVTACFMAISLPIFFKYQKKLCLIPLIAIVLTRSHIGGLIAITSILAAIYNSSYDRKYFRIYLLSFILLISLYIFRHQTLIYNDVIRRFSMWVGTLDGIKTNPILGWGMGSFEPIMARIPPAESVYLGVPFNTNTDFMNHPHSEIFYGWWNLGIGFVILLPMLIWNLIRKLIVENSLPFRIMINAFICSTLLFLQPPLWFLLMMAIGIHENKKEETNGQESRKES